MEGRVCVVVKGGIEVEVEIEADEEDHDAAYDASELQHMTSITPRNWTVVIGSCVSPRDAAACVQKYTARVYSV